MNNADQPINPQNYSRCGNGDNDFEPLVDGKKTGYERKMAGLTKKEYFAGLAMQAMISNMKPSSMDSIQEIPSNIAKWSLFFADELLKQLEIKSATEL